MRATRSIHASTISEARSKAKEDFDAFYEGEEYELVSEHAVPFMADPRTQRVEVWEVEFEAASGSDLLFSPQLSSGSTA